MESMTVAELLEILRINEAAQWNHFQIWITITFATIVASFVGRKQLTGPLRYLVSFLYLTATLTISSFFMYLAKHNRQIQLELIDRSVDLPGPAVTSISVTILLVFGVVSTIFFIHRSKVSNE